MTDPPMNTRAIRRASMYPERDTGVAPVTLPPTRSPAIRTSPSSPPQ